MFASLSAFEFTIAVEIFSVKLTTLYGAAYCIVFSRLFLSMLPTSMLCFDLIKRNGGSKFKPLIEHNHFIINSKTYSALMILCVFECNLLVYLPW